MLLAVGGLNLPARAAETPKELVPVGHTVGIKMFARRRSAALPKGM